MRPVLDELATVSMNVREQKQQPQIWDFAITFSGVTKPNGRYCCGF
jgi:hypothetical protein